MFFTFYPKIHLPLLIFSTDLISLNTKSKNAELQKNTLLNWFSDMFISNEKTNLMKKSFLYSGEFSGNSLLEKFQVILHFKILKNGLPRYPLRVLKLSKQL